MLQHMNNYDKILELISPHIFSGDKERIARIVLKIAVGSYNWGYEDAYLSDTAYPEESIKFLLSELSQRNL